MGWIYDTPGIPDGEFITGDVPITKSEVRALAISKLRLSEEHSVLDIGCGTGSVTVEAALICKKGKVVSIDKNEEAVGLTRSNAEKFGLENVEIILGKVPQELPRMLFDRIFVGGGGKAMGEIIAEAKNMLRQDSIIVVNTILLDSTCSALEALEKNGFRDIECICVSISRGYKVSGWMMKALNPIYIISAVMAQ